MDQEVRLETYLGTGSNKSFVNSQGLCLLDFRNFLEFIGIRKQNSLSRSETPSSRKWPKTSFMAIFFTIYAYCA